MRRLKKSHFLDQTFQHNADDNDNDKVVRNFSTRCLKRNDAVFFKNDAKFIE
jgi:hypothetical protein